MSEPSSDAPSSTPAQRLAWCLYDFGNSAYPTVIVTAAYAIYFRRVVVGDADPGRGDLLWGIATALGSLLVFLSGPVLGIVADRWRLKRVLLCAHAWFCVATTALMCLTGQGTVALAMLLVVVSIYGFDGGNVFYNAFLPELVPPAQMPSLSGRAWALGYLGGLLCLGLVIALLDVAAMPARWAPLVAAGWFLVFTLPTLFLLRDRRAVAADSQAGVLARLARVREHRTLVRFLLALFFYMNGLNTVYVFAAIFANQSLGFSEVESLVLVMVLNLVAAPGALVFGRLAARRSARHSIIVSLWLWLAVIAGAVLAAWPGLFAETGTRKAFFWGVAALASVGIGATQATSRTFVGQIAPPGMSGEFFGFMALAGRASAILGPFVFGQVSWLTGGDQRWAVATVGVFFAVGLVLMRRVPRGEAPLSS